RFLEYAAHRLVDGETLRSCPKLLLAGSHCLQTKAVHALLVGVGLAANHESVGKVWGNRRSPPSSRGVRMRQENASAICRSVQVGPAFPTPAPVPLASPKDKWMPCCFRSSHRGTSRLPLDDSIDCCKLWSSQLGDGFLQSM